MTKKKHHNLRYYITNAVYHRRRAGLFGDMALSTDDAGMSVKYSKLSEFHNSKSVESYDAAAEAIMNGKDVTSYLVRAAAAEIREAYIVGLVVNPSIRSCVLSILEQMDVCEQLPDTWFLSSQRTKKELT